MQTTLLTARAGPGDGPVAHRCYDALSAPYWRRTTSTSSLIRGRVKRVYMQADAPYRMGLDALQHIYTPRLGMSTGTANRCSPAAPARKASNSQRLSDPGQSVGVSKPSISPYNMVPLSSVVKGRMGHRPVVAARASTATRQWKSWVILPPGYSTGQAMQALQNIIDKDLPGGFCFGLDRPVLSRRSCPATRPYVAAPVDPGRVPAPVRAV